MKFYWAQDVFARFIWRCTPGFLAHIQSAFEEELDKTHKGDLLVFYYCGHGWRPDDQPDNKDVLFANYDAGDDEAPGWSGCSIFDTIGMSGLARGESASRNLKSNRREVSPHANSSRIGWPLPS